MWQVGVAQFLVGRMPLCGTAAERLAHTRICGGRPFPFGLEGIKTSRRASEARLSMRSGTFQCASDREMVVKYSVEALWFDEVFRLVYQEK
jgi:hypothetical protein